LVAEYNEIIASFAPTIGEIDARVHAELERRRILYGGKVARTFLRPSLVTRKQLRMLEHACNVLIGSVNTILSNVFEGSIDRMGSTLGIGADELELIRLDPGYSTIVAINRMDAFVLDDELTFLEFNCDSPAGIAYADVFVEILEQTPTHQEFARRHRVTTTSGREALLDAFRRIYREWGDSRPMRVAIVDWKGVATSAEFDMFRELFEANGIPCTVADPREAELDGETLSFGGFETTLVYRRVIAGELLAKKDEARPLLDAYRRRAACFINSFRSRLADNKAIFWLLSDPALARHFSDEENAVFRATIPWTRLVRPGRTDVDGEDVDVLDYVRANRERLVIKANVSYGGRDVVLGWETSQNAWEQAIETALGGSWVVQRRVAIPEELFPVITGAELTFEPRKININPFALGGRFGGCVSRLSTQSIINVAVGGGAVPLFVVEDGASWRS
jgi:uncharacterized circularly permuted ATP-grasp superfamily protein